MQTIMIFIILLFVGGCSSTPKKTSPVNPFMELANDMRREREGFYYNYAYARDLYEILNEGNPFDRVLDLQKFEQKYGVKIDPVTGSRK